MQGRTAKLWLATLRSTRFALACPASSFFSVSSPFESATAQGGGQPYIMGKMALSFFSLAFAFSVIKYFSFVCHV